MIDIRINAKTRRPLRSNYYIGVQSDNKAQSVRFILPRFVDDIDLGEYIPLINVESGGFADVARLDISSEAEYVKIPYIIGGALMNDSGVVVCKLKFVSEQDEQVCVWNTEPIYLNISGTIGSEERIEQEYPTIISQHTVDIANLKGICQSNSASIDELNEEVTSLVSNQALLSDGLDQINVDLLSVNVDIDELRGAVAQLQIEVTGVAALQLENLGIIGG